MIKLILELSNRALSRYNHMETPSLWVYWHKWNYEHTLIKNVLQFSNRVLKEVNRYHFFRWEWMVGLAGALAGFIVTQLEEVYYQVRIGYKPTASNLVINGVLKNPAVSTKLKDVLDSNVFRNQETQYFVHQSLLNQVIAPQKEQIKALILMALRSLNDPQNVDFLSSLLANNIGVLAQPIKVNALQFLDSPTMDGITANGLKSVLESLFVK